MKKRAWFFFVMFFCINALAACQPEPAALAPTLSVTLPPVEITRQPASAAPADNPNVKVSMSCSRAGAVKRYQLDSALMNGTQYVTVYLPPCYDENKEGGYAVLYLLHGQTFNDEMWLDLDAGEIADELISGGAAKPFLMVMPYEEFYYRQPENNNFSQTFIEEIVPFVDSTSTLARSALPRVGRHFARGFLGGAPRAAALGAVRLGRRPQPAHLQGRSGSPAGMAG